VGLLTLAQPMATALSAGLDVEVYVTALAPLPTWSGPGLHGCINQALMAMVARKRIALTSTGANRYDLSAYPWLVSENQLVNTQDVERQTGVDPLNLWGGGEIRTDGQARYLLVDSTVVTGDTFSIDVWRPVGTWVRHGDVWADSTVGLVNESDAVDVDHDLLTLCAYYYVCDTMAKRLRTQPSEKYWLTERERTARQAGPILLMERGLSRTKPGRGQNSTLMTGRSRGGYSWP
jgi:hypothetical protein